MSVEKSSAIECLVFNVFTVFCVQGRFCVVCQPVARRKMTSQAVRMTSQAEFVTSQAAKMTSQAVRWVGVIPKAARAVGVTSGGRGAPEFQWVRRFIVTS